jgi:predicted nuclease of predicted toxin-antitoxin system
VPSLRFLIDQDVAAEVGEALRLMGHECWSAADAGLSDAGDDSLTVYAIEKKAILITHDRAFTTRRRLNAVGQHIRLKCPEEDAADLIVRSLPAVEEWLRRSDNICMTISPSGRIIVSTKWT